MISTNLKLIVFVVFFQTVTHASPDTTNFQAHISKPDGTDLTSNAVTFTFKYKNDAGNCTLYTETYSSMDMTGSSGDVNIQLGSGAPSFPVAGVALVDIFSNSATNTMNCVEGGNYTPTLLNEKRKLVVEFSYAGSNGTQSLPSVDIASVPYAMYASDAGSLGGFAANLYAKFADVTTCAGGQFLTFNGTVFSCAAPGAPVNFTGTLSGDVTGTQNATVVSSLRGRALSAAVPASGEFIGFDGTTWKPMAVAGAAGGTVTSVTSTNLYLSVASSTSTPALTVNVGQAANTVAAGDDARIVGAWQAGSALSGDVTGTLANNTVSTVGGKTAAQVNTSVNDTLAATSLNTPSTIVKRDASGDVTVSRASAVDFAGRNFLFYDSGVNKITVKSPNALTSGDYTLTLPDGTGTNGYVLSTNGAGVTSWIPAATGSVTNVTATAPVQSSGGATPNISLAKATAGADGYLASTDWTTFNNKQNTLAAANAATDGYLTSADWTTFNNKQAAGAYITQLSGDVTGVGPGISTVTLATITSSATVGSASAVPTITYDAKGRITSSSSNAYQDATGAIKGIVQVGNNINVAGGVISVATATSTTTGVITSADFSSFSSKVSSQWTTSTDTTSIYYNGGSVAIGTTTPSGYLTVVNSFNEITPNIGRFMAQNLTQGIGIGYRSIEAIGSLANQDIVFTPKGTGDIITTAGTLGVGVTPTVAGVGAMINGNMSVGAGYVNIAPPTDGMIIQGSVGVGKNNPGYAVDVSGDVNVTGVFRVGGTPISTGGFNGAKAYGNNASIAAGETVIDLTNETYDSNNLHSNVTDPSRITAATTGYYSVSTSVCWTGGTAGTHRILKLKKNGAAFSATKLVATAGGAGGYRDCQNISTIIQLNSTDYVTMAVEHDSGVNAWYVSDGGSEPTLSIHLIGQ